jgi:N-methylhydantoinase A
VGEHPSKIPMIDVVTVGAGGGSVAWLSPEGTLKVGPRSAGADPGPMCYPGGGAEPTVTDAHLVLGRIPPHLLGGEIPLAVDAARAGLAALGARVDLPLERTATGILEISAWNQANALRQVTVARGLDVRDFTLTTFGGSGSLLACRLMDVLGLPRTLVPPDPGNVSAFGLLTVDVRNDHVQTAIQPHAALDLDRVRASPRRSSGCSAAPTCATSGRPSRCACRCPTARWTPPPATGWPRPSTPRTAGSTATTSPPTRGRGWSGSTCG